MSQVKQAAKQAALIQAYKDTFGTAQGEIVLKDMMKNHGILGTMFDGDVNGMLVKEGERRVVLKILSTLNLDVAKLKERIDQYALEQDE